MNDYMRLEWYCTFCLVYTSLYVWRRKRKKTFKFAFSKPMFISLCYIVIVIERSKAVCLIFCRARWTQSTRGRGCSWSAVVWHTPPWRCSSWRRSCKTVKSEVTHRWRGCSWSAVVSQTPPWWGSCKTVISELTHKGRGCSCCAVVWHTLPLWRSCETVISKLTHSWRSCSCCAVVWHKPPLWRSCKTVISKLTHRWRDCSYCTMCIVQWFDTHRMTLFFMAEALHNSNIRIDS